MSKLVNRKLQRAQLGFKCRCKWLSRRGISHFTSEDKILHSLFRQCEKYYRLQQYLKEKDRGAATRP